MGGQGAQRRALRILPVIGQLLSAGDISRVGCLCSWAGNFRLELGIYCGTNLTNLTQIMEKMGIHVWNRKTFPSL